MRFNNAKIDPFDLFLIGRQTTVRDGDNLFDIAKTLHDNFFQGAVILEGELRGVAGGRNFGERIFCHAASGIVELRHSGFGCHRQGKEQRSQEHRADQSVNEFEHETAS